MKRLINLTLVLHLFALVQVFLFPIQAFASDLTASIPRKNIFLYAKKDTFHFFDFFLKINKQFIHFPLWQNIYDPEFKPKLHYIDMNADLKKEVVVILTVAQGVGGVDQKVHVLSKLNGLYQEVNVEQPEKVIKELVDVKVNENQLFVNIDGHLYNLDISKFNDLQGRHSPSYSQIRFDIDNNQLAAFTSIKISPSKPIGELKITYKLSGQRVTKDKIDLIVF